MVVLGLSIIGLFYCFFFRSFIISLFYVVFQVIGCVVSVFLISPRLTLTMVVVVPSIIGFGSLIGSVLRRLSRMAQAQVCHHNQFI